MVSKIIAFGVVLAVNCIGLAIYCSRSKKSSPNTYRGTEQQQGKRNEISNQTSATGPSATPNIKLNVSIARTDPQDDSRVLINRFMKQDSIIQTECRFETVAHQQQPTVLTKYADEPVWKSSETVVRPQLPKALRRSAASFGEPTPAIYQPPVMYSESNYQRQISAYWSAKEEGLSGWFYPYQPFTQPLPVEAKAKRTKRQPALPTFVYHYTNKTGYDGIMRDSKILASGFFGKRNGTLFGDGVYLTTLGPGSKTRNLTAKNFGKSSKQFKPSRTEYVFKLRSSDLPGLRYVHPRDKQRQTILLHPWSFIDLNDCSYTVYKRNVKDSDFPGSQNTVHLIEVSGM